MIMAGFGKRIYNSPFPGNNKELRMKWKKHALRIMLITVSIVAGFFAIAPGVAVCADQLEAKKLASIDSITPTGDGSATELTIKLTSPATYTSYKTTSPLRLVIDFSQVTLGNITAPVIVNKGNFKTVVASRFDTDAGVLTRVEIELVSDSEALISALPSNPGELKVSFPALADIGLSESNKEHADKLKTAALAEPPAATLESASVIGNETQFRTLTAISVKNNAITLALDGLISDFKTFRLNKPERYVVDLMNAKSGLSTRLLPLNASGVASARIGLYPDKVRVVLDAVNGSFPEATAVKDDSGVIITLDFKANDENTNTKLVSTRVEKSAEENTPVVTSGKKVETTHALNAEAAKQAISDKPNSKETIKFQSPGISTIEMIDFQVIEGISRVSIKVNGSINVDQPAKTPGYVTLTIKNSKLPKNLQRSLETRSFASPVLRVTPITIKTKKNTNTKIRIAMRVAAPFEYRQEGDMLFVDFKNPEGLTAAKNQAEVQYSKNAKASQGNTPAHEEASIASELVKQADSNNLTEPAKVYTGRKITLEFADAEVRKIFQLLSEVSGKNFVLGDEISGNISLKLVNVPWTQALEIILETKGFESREENNVMMIRGAGKLKSQMDADADKRQAQMKSGRMITKNFAINYSNSEDVYAALKPLFKHDWQGTIISDRRTNTVIVNAVEQLMNDIEKLVKVIDIPERQVMIEARIVEASSTFTQSIGINWGVHYVDGSAALLGINGLNSGFGGLASAASPTSGTGSSPGGNADISFGTLGSNIRLDMRLNAAASAGMIKIISAPKIATLNNKPAKISQGQQIPYQNTTATTGAVTAFVAATLSLEVTPHINANGTISMSIDAKNDSAGTGSPPPINTKQAKTEMLLRDGETTVIGGIFVDSKTESDDGVPYLMDIPFLGKLFKSNSKTLTKTELLIFITPRILNSI